VDNIETPFRASLDSRIAKHMNKKIQESHRLAYKTNDYETQENYTGKMPQVYAFESIKEVEVDVQIPIELTHRNPIHSKGLFDSKDLYRKTVELNPIKKIL
jgi:hypothetical protein